MQVTIGGAASLLAGLLLTWLLATPVLSDHRRFALIFILASVIMLMSLFFIRLVRDPNPIQIPEKLDIRRYYARVPSVIRGSKPLQRALIARAFSYAGFSTLSFIVVFGAGLLKLPETRVSWLVYANIAGGLIGGISLGEASRRFGNKAVILMCNTGVFIALAMAISLNFMPALGYGWLFAICALASLTMGNWVGYFNYFIDIAPGRDRSVFQVISVCIGIPFSFAGYAMGAVIDNFGYVAMFVTGGAFAFATILLSLRLMSKRKIQESGISYDVSADNSNDGYDDVSGDSSMDSSAEQ
jgi:predicted MFS family arabinose efflux permease